MSIVLVIGLGPRTGTSFVMTQAKHNGIPIHGVKFINNVTVEHHNPDGYWETFQYNSNIDNCLVKLWYPVFTEVNPKNISRILVLERKNKDNQFSSMLKVFKDECILNNDFRNLSVTKKWLDNYISVTENWLSTIDDKKIKKVYTEDLNKNLEEILCFIKGGLTCQQQPL
jgi:hypothetical protein